jgi:hypothetical protein
MTLLEEYNKSEKIKIFRGLVSTPLALIVLKKFFGKKIEIQNKSLKIIHKNSSKTISNSRQILNLKDKYLIFTDNKRRHKIIFSNNVTNIDEEKDKEKEKKAGRNKLASINISNNIKIAKNPYKIQDYPTNTSKNNFIKTGLTYHNNKSTTNNNNQVYPDIKSVRTHSSKENINLKESLRISKLRKSQKKSAGHILINTIKMSKEKEKSNINIHKNRLFLTEKKNIENNNTNSYKNNNNILNNNTDNKLLLSKHIIIESKNRNRNDSNDIKKNNNENTNIVAILDKNKYNFNNKINLQLKYKENTHRYNLKQKDRNNLLKDIFNNEDFN